jgi:hypothetical protein
MPKKREKGKTHSASHGIFGYNPGYFIDGRSWEPVCQELRRVLGSWGQDRAASSVAAAPSSRSVAVVS